MTDNYEKTHDGVMNNIDSLIEFNHKLDWLKFGNSVEYAEASSSLFNLFKALAENNLTVKDNEE